MAEKVLTSRVPFWLLVPGASARRRWPVRQAMQPTSMVGPVPFGSRETSRPSGLQAPSVRQLSVPSRKQTSRPSSTWNKVRSAGSCVARINSITCSLVFPSAQLYLSALCPPDVLKEAAAAYIGPSLHVEANPEALRGARATCFVTHLDAWSK